MSDALTTADVLKKIKDDLAWRGPTGKPLGHVVLSRNDAEYLMRVVTMIILERDALVYEKENRGGAGGS